MYGSYGSYSSMGASAWEPINISSTSTSRTGDSNSCAYPSWPRRDSLSSNEHSIPNSFLSDDDLFLLADSDDVRSESSFGSSSPAEDEFTANSANNRFLECQREREALFAEQQYQRQQQRIQQREAIKMVQLEKERRKAAAKKSRRPKKNAKLTAISE
ncbi:hypothetical protein BROUX41_000358 [Berkeleyomyces rouxiae]|uniref:uncharacterized protein n=1 Tax=Berkeleyomyces rouxiae TaxID=2035830 RepID=UPI003B7BF932